MPKRALPREETSQEAINEENVDETEKIIVSELKAHKQGQFVPKTSLGREVVEGRITSLYQIFEEGRKITEPEIVDMLLPNLSSEIIMIGGSTGKGGGIKRTAVKRTTRMHKSGRRYRISVMTAVGDKSGFLGIGFAKGPVQLHKEVANRSLRDAKLNIFPVKLGCGSWECMCGGKHSIPFNTRGKAGSVRIELKPAPNGVGIVASDEIKKILRLAGIRDIWCKSRGQTQTRINFVYALVDALKNINKARAPT